MLVIRDRQIERLNRFAEEEFIDELTLEVRDLHGDLVGELSDEELREMVAAGVARARRHGLTIEDTIGTFVGWMFEFAPNFDEQENIKKMLADESLAPDDRIELIVQATTEADWAQAEAMSDETAWEE
jgi:hypothetical protein